MVKLGWFMSDINRNIPTRWRWACGDSWFVRLFVLQCTWVAGTTALIYPTDLFEVFKHCKALIQRNIWQKKKKTTPKSEKKIVKRKMVFCYVSVYMQPCLKTALRKSSVHIFQDNAKESLINDCPSSNTISMTFRGGLYLGVPVSSVSVPWPIWSSGGHDRRFSRDPLPLFFFFCGRP